MANIFRDHGEAFCSGHAGHLGQVEHRVMAAIEACRTPQLDGRVEQPHWSCPMRRYALRDDQWERIRDMLPEREGHVGVTATDNRPFVEAVLYRFRAGIPWRDLPERFCDWKNGAADADNEYPMIDSTVVRPAQ